MFRSRTIEFLTRDCGTHTGAWRICTLRHALSWWISGYIPGVDADVLGDGSVRWFRTRGMRYVSRAAGPYDVPGPRVEVMPTRCEAWLRTDSPDWGRTLHTYCHLPAGHAGDHVCGDGDNVLVAFPRSELRDDAQ